MKGSRYYKNLDFSKPVGTHRYVDNIKDRRQLAKVCLVAMARINQAEQGTITEPYELASFTMKDGRTLIQTIYKDRPGTGTKTYYDIVQSDPENVGISGFTAHYLRMADKNKFSPEYHVLQYVRFYLGDPQDQGEYVCVVEFDFT